MTGERFKFHLGEEVLWKGREPYGDTYIYNCGVRAGKPVYPLEQFGPAPPSMELDDWIAEDERHVRDDVHGRKKDIRAKFGARFWEVLARYKPRKATFTLMSGEVIDNQTLLREHEGAVAQVHVEEA